MQASSLSSIVQRPRMNQRLLALDVHRMKQLGKSLIDVPAEEEPEAWGSFLDFELPTESEPVTDTFSGEQLSPCSDGAPSALLEGGLSAVRSHSHFQDDSLPVIFFPFSTTCTSEVPKGLDTFDRTCRQRPTKGSSNFTVASSSSAVAAPALVGALKGSTGIRPH